jgi:hypothetical protein
MDPKLSDNLLSQGRTTGVDAGDEKVVCIAIGCPHVQEYS